MGKFIKSLMRLMILVVFFIDTHVINPTVFLAQI